MFLVSSEMIFIRFKNLIRFKPQRHNHFRMSTDFLQAREHFKGNASCFSSPSSARALQPVLEWHQHHTWPNPRNQEKTDNCSDTRKHTENNMCWWRCEETETFLCCVYIKWYSPCGKLFGSSSKNSTELLYDLAIPLLRLYSRKLKAYLHTKTCTRNVITFFITA